MREDLLQYIWKFRYFNNQNLRTTGGDPLQILFPGTQNQDQGPDFLDAKIRIGDTVWVGNVELHILSKQWNQHQHQKDSNYKNVILHVVWEHDGNVKDVTGQVLPTLELKDRIPKLLMERYRELLEKEQLQHRFFIPCEKFAHQVPEITWTSWKARLTAERLEQKTEKIFRVLEQTHIHWDETMWRVIAANFGGRINGQTFQRIAETIAQKILARHKNQHTVVEALLFGQAGLLDREFGDKYPQMLQREFGFYKQKYQLQKVDGQLSFARMRPANFPTIRLTQLAALIVKSSHLFSYVKEIDSISDLMELLKVSPNDFWLYHYKFDDEHKEEKKEKQLGRQMVENLIINTVCPMLFAYGIYNKEEGCKEKALKWLEELSPEKNHITSGFMDLGVENKNAFDSQALIQLKNNYCDKKRCLECAIGNAILGRTVHDS